ncbi:MAG: hypothetical protein CL946_05060 [Ectothiorhodospiraceae bacterium]|nr:hypothetical protein [Ectothiorhodospiraceae bacterium]
MKHFVLLLLPLLLLLASCGSTIPNRAPIGERFPRVEGKSLADEEYVLPDAFEGQRVILIVAYKQKTQFDVDRWGIGFFTADLDLPPVYEIPTIPGMIPALFKGSIDEGMRSGIPSQSWSDVITVYGSGGSTLAEWTGTENPNNARVILLDENGKVEWFYDEGYGLPPLESLLEKLGSIETE